MDNIDYTKCCILYIDDEAENLDGFKFTFRRTYKVLTASSVEEGREILQKSQVHILVSDHKMPGMTGVEFLSEVKQRYPDIIRIILTAFADVGIMMEAVNSGDVYRFLAKPWEKSQMQNTLNNAYETYLLRGENKQLVKTLQESNYALELHKNKLEDLVKDRTMELEQLNEELMSSNEELNAVNDALVEEVDRRKVLQQELEKHKNNLEVLVKERTSELVESEAKIRQLAENVNEVFILLDSHTDEILYVNNKFGELFDGNIPIVFKDLASLETYFVGDSRQAFINYLNREETEAEYEFRASFANNEKWLWLREKSLYNAAGSAYRSIITIIDISQQKEAELTIQKANIELEQHRTKLEELVQERTEELASANEELAATNEELVSSNDQLLYANERIAESESKLQAYIDQSAEGITFIGADQKIIDWNPEMERITERSKDEALGMDAVDLMIDMLSDDMPREEISKEERNMLLEMLEGNKATRNMEGVILNKENQRRFIMSSTFPISTEHGMFIGRITRDVTEKKQQEIELEKYRNHLEELVEQRARELTKSEEKYRNLFEQAGDGILVGIDPGVIVDANVAILKLLEFKREELIGKHINELFPKHVLNERPLQFDLLQQGQTVTIERVIQSSTGKLINIEMTSKILPDGHYQSVIRDITERIKSQEYLKLSANIVENTQLGLHIYQLEDSDDDRSLKLINANPSSKRLTGINPGSIVGKQIDEIFPNLREKGIPEKYANVVRNQAPIEIEDFYYSDDRILNAAFNIKAFPIPGNRVAISFDNVTERIKAEMALNYRSGFEKLLSRISNTFIKIAFGELPGKITEALRLLAEYIDADGSYIALFDEGAKTFSHKYSWCNGLVKFNSEQLTKLPIDIVGYWSKRLNKQQAVILSSIDELPPESATIKQIIKDQNIGSLIDLTLVYQNEAIGVMGFANSTKGRQWNKEEQSLLSIAAQVITNAIKRSELFKALESSERNYREVFNATNEGIFIHDAESGAILDVNQAVLEAYQISYEEALNATVGDLSSSQEFNNERAAELIRKARDIGPQTFEWLAKRKDGTTFWAEIVLKLGEIAGEKRVIAVTRNINDRITARKEIEKTNRYLHNIINLSPNVIYIWNIQEDKLVYLSEKSVQMLGVDANEISEINNVSKDLVFDEDLDELEAYRQALLRSNDDEVIKAELRIKHSSGGHIWANISGVVYKRDNAKKPLETLHVLDEITDRKIAELALQESEVKFRTLFESAHDAIFLMKEDIFVTCNPTALKMFRCREEDIIGHIPADLSPKHQSNGESSATIVKEKLKDALKGGVQSFEWLYMRKDETLFYAEVSLNKIEIGNEQFVQAIVRDIDDRKKAEAEIRKNEYFIQQIADTVPGMLYVLDLETRNNIYINREFWKHLGYEQEDADQFGENVLEKLMHPDDLPKLKRFKAKLSKARDGEVILDEYRLKNKGGEYRWFNDWNTVFVRDEYGKPLQTLGIAIDITASKFFELALKESEEKFRNLFNSSTDSIIIFDMDMKYIEVNTTFMQETGYARHEIIGRKLSDLIVVTGQSGIFRNSYKDLKAGDALPSFETEIRTKKDQIISVEVNSRVVDYGGQKAILSLARDISERKQIERRIFDTMIETEERERQRLATDLHDEIGPILSSLKMYISTLSETDNIEKITFIITQVKDLIKEAITSVREISNALSPHILTHYGINSAVKLVIEKANEFLNIDWDTNIEDLRFHINIEIVYYRIIKELINNTIKHAQAENVTLKLVFIDGYLILRYADNGIGFDYEAEMKEKKDGIGLFSILNRVKTIEASYNFDTGPGEGCKFELATKTEAIKTE